MADASSSRGTGMKHKSWQFNFGAQVRARTQPRTIASFLPIALFAALVAALAFIV